MPASSLETTIFSHDLPVIFSIRASAPIPASKLSNKVATSLAMNMPTVMMMIDARTFGIMLKIAVTTIFAGLEIVVIPS